MTAGTQPAGAVAQSASPSATLRAICKYSGARVCSKHVAQSNNRPGARARNKTYFGLLSSERRGSSFYDVHAIRT